MPTPSRTCSRCGEDFPATLEYFYKDSNRPGQLRYACKSCIREQVKASGWEATPKAMRHRKGITLTLSDEARTRLDKLAERRETSRSVVVEDLIMGTKK